MVVLSLAMTVMMLAVSFGVAIFQRDAHRRFGDAKTLSLVRAAEQIYGPGKGETKRRFVRERMQRRGLGEVAREDLEAAVWLLRLEQKDGGSQRRDNGGAT